MISTGLGRQTAWVILCWSKTIKNEKCFASPRLVRFCGTDNQSRSFGVPSRNAWKRASELRKLFEINHGKNERQVGSCRRICEEGEDEKKESCGSYVSIKRNSFSWLLQNLKMAVDELTCALLIWPVT